MIWQDFDNKHKGETGLIICNGNSLADVPIGLLARFPSFGLNGIYKLHFQPTYYVAVNELVLSQFYISKVVCDQKFVKASYAEGTVALPLYSDYRDDSIFSKQPYDWIYEGGTVTYVALQIAYFMGFKTILLVGLDHKFTYSGQPNEEVIIQEDCNHFIKDYFEPGMKFNNPDLGASEISYAEARRVYEADGRRIINLTPNSEEQIFEKGSIRKWKSYE